MPRIARNMFDSVRVRLTAWYSAVLAVVLVLVSATTYFIVRKTSMQRTDGDLAVLADSFLVTFQAELLDAPNAQGSAILSAARQSMVEHRSNNDIFLVLGPGGGSDRSVASALGSSEFQSFTKIRESKEVALETIRAEGSRF